MVVKGYVPPTMMKSYVTSIIHCGVLVRFYVFPSSEDSVLAPSYISQRSCP
jgi:hypothetical protein